MNLHKFTSFSNSTLLFALIGALFLNQLNSLPKKEELLLIRDNPFLSYDLKMRIKLGPELYEYFQFLQKNLPEETTVYIPPMMEPWGYTGNPGMVRYFLYPRKILPGKLEDKGIPQEATHALIVWGERQGKDCKICGWPKTEYQEENAIYLKEDPPWGIIVLKGGLND